MGLCVGRQQKNLKALKYIAVPSRSYIRSSYRGFCVLPQLGQVNYRKKTQKHHHSRWCFSFKGVFSAKFGLNTPLTVHFFTKNTFFQPKNRIFAHFFRLLEKIKTARRGSHYQYNWQEACRVVFILFYGVFYKQFNYIKNYII